MARPWLYDPAYVDEVMAFCDGGRSLTSYAAHLGVTRQTITNWRKHYPDFDEACEVAKAKAAAWWESRALEVASGETNAPPAMITFGLKNMSPADWKDTQQIEHSGPDGGTLKVVYEIVDSPGSPGLPPTA